MPIAVIALIVLAAVGAGAYFFTTAPTNESTITISNEATRPAEEETRSEELTIVTNNDEPEPTEPEPSSDTSGTYTDGTYRATGSYLTPRRTEQTIEVELTLENDVVVASTIIYDELESGYSNDNQARFDAAYAAQVVGQPLDAINLSRVGSASLTSNAFNEAKLKIATEARG